MTSYYCNIISMVVVDGVVCPAVRGSVEVTVFINAKCKKVQVGVKSVTNCTEKALP